MIDHQLEQYDYEAEPGIITLPDGSVALAMKGDILWGYETETGLVIVEHERRTRH